MTAAAKLYHITIIVNQLTWSGEVASKQRERSHDALLTAGIIISTKKKGGNEEKHSLGVCVRDPDGFYFRDGIFWIGI